MPRCQRTFFRLGTGSAAGSGLMRWTCRHCAEGETYEMVGAPDLLAYRDAALRFCTQQFGPPPDAALPTLLLLGLRPESVYEPGDRRYDLYLQNGSDPWQLRLQIGHEMFHRVCSRGRIFHWTHEMFACLVSLRLLRGHGLSEYADRMARHWGSEATKCSLSEMLCTDLWTTDAYPPGFYGRAYTTGAALTAAVGWQRLCWLAGSFSGRERRAPDLERWRARLPAPLRARVAATLDLPAQQEPAAPNGNDDASAEEAGAPVAARDLF
jgi:hypothetical protein